jgi:hypothetical protein
MDIARAPQQNADLFHHPLKITSAPTTMPVRSFFFVLCYLRLHVY